MLPAGSIGEDEYRRMWRVVDMSLTGHSWLRDRYKRRHNLLLGFILVLSLVASSLAFASDETTRSLFGVGFSPQVVGGTMTLTIFFVALVDLIVDWRRRSWEHAIAADRFSELKQQFRAVSIDDSGVVEGGEELRKAYGEVTMKPPQLPEDLFPRVKARHLRKIETSKFMDAHPGGSLLMARIHVWWRGNFAHDQTNSGPGQETDDGDDRSENA